MRAASPLIDAPALRSLLTGDAPPVVLDASFDLAAPQAGEQAYRAEHVPGAHYAHLDRDLSGAKTGLNGRHPLPERDAFAATVAGWGITPGTQVVAYDRQGSVYAARTWWLLRWLGHADVRVLDGGLAAWKAAGGTVDSAQPARRAAPAYPQAHPLLGSIDAQSLQRGLGRLSLLDARAPERFRGDVEPLDPVAGHIPGALNRPYTKNLDANGRFLARSALRAEFEPLFGGRDASQVVNQCGSGVTAAHNVLAIAAAGLGDSLLYPGSWSEWCADPGRPIARGG
ncbi:MAG TPA: sulfurtransferase [Burkholderiaceae bacterium]|nr:sulfurtransferase [Burkholderiaceae bacterium]